MRRALSSLMVLATVAVHSSGAQTSFGLHVNGAFLDAPGAGSEMYNFGIGGGVHLDVDFVPLVAMRISADYYSFPAEPEKYKTTVTPGATVRYEGGRAGMFAGTVNGKVSTGIPVVTPYFTAGVGVGALTSTELRIRSSGQADVTVKPIPASTKVLLNAGVGADVSIVVATVFIEARYAVVLTEGESTSFIPLTVGVTF